MKHGEQPIHFLLHVMGWLHDVCFEQRINDGVFTRFVVNVMDFGSEDFVFAMFAPSLSKAFLFHVRRRIGRDVHGLTLGPNGIVSVVSLNGMHLIEVQSQEAIV